MNQCFSCIIGIEPIAVCLYLLRSSDPRWPHLLWTLKHTNEIAYIIYGPFNLNRRSRQRRYLNQALAVFFLQLLPWVIHTIFDEHALLQNRKMLQGCCVFFLSLAFFLEDQSVFFLELTPLLTKIFHAVLSSANLTFLKSLHPYGTCSGCSYIGPWISALVVLWVSYHEPPSQITAAWEFCCHPYASRVQATLVSFCTE